MSDMCWNLTIKHCECNKSITFVYPTVDEALKALDSIKQSTSIKLSFKLKKTKRA